MYYYNVFIKNAASSFDSLYTYESELQLPLGVRVVVPFGRGNATQIALVVSTAHKTEGKPLKAIRQVLDREPIVTEDLLELGFFMHDYYLTSFNQSFAPLLPPGDIKQVKKSWVLTGAGRQLIESDTRELKNLAPEIIEDYAKRGLIKEQVSIETIGKVKTETLYHLAPDYLKMLQQSKKLTDKQMDVVKFLTAHSKGTQKDILSRLGLSSSPLNTLVKKGIVVKSEEEVDRTVSTFIPTSGHRLNVEQLQAYYGILQSTKPISLLHGKTGSGKTEVYLKLAQTVIKEGGQVVVLVPEIGLTPQMIERFKGRFEGNVAILHSKLSRGERFDAWRKIKNGEVAIAIGVRSCVFAPFENLKMIIIDEEHDNSYRFHNALRYDTFDVAAYRMRQNNGKVVLGSATPDVSTYYGVRQGTIDVFELKRRAVAGAQEPETYIVDMRSELIQGNTSIFSAQLQQALDATMAKGAQAILFLNRRGFSNFISCRQCGHVINCDNCDISMTVHKSMGRLRCHYCGATKPIPKVCPVCGSSYIKQFGVGTQQVEEVCRKLYPDKKIIRMDRDSTYEKDAYDRVYDMMKHGEGDILIGTQMLAKGLDFKNVLLVGVIAADLSLNIADYKAEEVTFDLLTQVAGRAGRGIMRGNVIIQTYTPENYAITYAKNHDYIGFYEEEIQQRKAFHYPPFVEIINLEFKGDTMDRVQSLAEVSLEKIGEEIKDFQVQHSRIITLPKINNVYRAKFTLKVAPRDRSKLLEVLNRVLEESKDYVKNNTYLQIDFKQ
ncbi:primosomal protein N' [Peptoniphilus equinus]|uniref:Replication restart protein PriA n=1 Tax=Peptoniphilus equinus TaxID=3016343 RepID=A0ABY7QR54_9FIRM|nr:primosomal protein N' [Peptoniphilus equinus]WBW49257.1 primosomal protein N' [Peptoniphilus equinus]